MTDARVYHEYVEAVIVNNPYARVYHEYVEAVIVNAGVEWAIGRLQIA